MGYGIDPRAFGTDGAVPPVLPASGTRRGIALLLAGNALTLALALWQDWPIGTLLWPYWCQSVAIGWFNFQRMRALGRFSTAGLSSGGRRVPETEQGKRSTANFFLGHFGTFHVAYLLFLLAFSPPLALAWPWLAATVLALVVAQARIHRDELASDALGRPNLGLMMMAPYVRVVPMHLILCVGAGALVEGAAALVLVVVLKTAGDVATHLIEQHLVARSAAAGMAGASPPS